MRRVSILLGLLVALLLGVTASASAQQADNLAVLQKRLTEAGCYTGPIDGQASAALDSAKQACPDQRPQLRIETGMHVAAIHDIAVDAACTRAVTGSDDKTIRIWSLPDGKLQRVIRPPIGPGHDGKINAVALSPDGRWIAAGGWDTPVSQPDYVTLYPVDGGPPRRFGPLSNVIDSLAFSPDGHRLAVGLGIAGGLHVFDLDSGRDIRPDLRYGDSIYGLAYASDGSLFTASDDGSLRHYGVDLDPPKPVKARGKDPFSLAVSPDGTRLAVGYDREPRVDLFSTETLAFLNTADVKGIDAGKLANNDLSSVAWMRDGSLHGAGTYGSQVDGAYKRFIRDWSQDGRRSGTDRPLSIQTIMKFRSCGNGLAFAAGDPAFGLIGPSGQARTLGLSAAPGMRGKVGRDFQISADARRIYFGLGENADKPVLFDLTQASLSETRTIPSDLVAPRIQGVPVDRWQNNASPRFSSRTLVLPQSETSRSLAIRHDKAGFFLGTDYWLRAYDSRGVERVPSTAMTGTVWGLDLTPDDRILVAAVDDGTIRWYSARDRSELLALFVDALDRRWVAWTPSGYYMASAGGEDLIGWHINRGWNQEAEFYPASLFHQRFYRPDIVRLVLTTLNEDQAVARADAERERQPGAPTTPPVAAPSPYAANLPPQVTIVSPADGGHFSTPSTEITYRLHASPGQTIDQIQLSIDGRRVASDRGKFQDNEERTVTLDVPKRDVLIEVKVSAGTLGGSAARVKLAFDGPPPPTPTKPDLYVLALGVDNYVNADEYPRTYATVDVADLTAAFKKQEGGMFEHVIVKDFLDNQVNIFSLRGAYDALSQATDNDYVIIYVVGHGFVSPKDQSYNFMLRLADKGQLNSTSLSARDLMDPLSRIGGKKILLIESCHSGRAASYNMDDAQNALRQVAPDGVFIVTASQGVEPAHFDARWKNHGAFTQALIEAIGDGKAADKDRKITILSLFNYLGQRIPLMTDQAQHPTITPPVRTISDFTIAVARQ